MGFNVDRPLYHATAADIREFKPNSYRGGASFFADTPAGAAEGAAAGRREMGVGMTEGRNVIKGYTSAKVYGRDINTDKLREIVGDLPAKMSFDAADDWMSTAHDKIRAYAEKNIRDETTREQFVKLAGDDLEAAYGVDRHDYLDDPERMLRLQPNAKRAREKSTAWEVFERGPRYGMQGEARESTNRAMRLLGYEGALIADEAGSKTVALMDPSKFRSTQAAFDPAKRGSADILAGVGGAAVVTGAGMRAAQDERPAGERAAEGLSALAAPEAWLRDR
jgi:hypothetical protein